MRPRGAIISPRHKLARAVPFRVEGTPPAQSLALPKQTSYWGNSRWGDCVSAEEAMAKAVSSVAAGDAELFIDEESLVQWARENGYLNGADLSSVMETMAEKGMVFPDRKVYHDGPAKAVDWTDENVLRAAIATGPVKIAVDAMPYERIVQQSNGWVMVGIPHHWNYDHCVGIIGYGPAKWLADQLGATLPQGVDPGQTMYAVFTWNTVGIVDHVSISNNCAEAWVRTPTTPEIVPVPAPPPPPPPPTPGPGPTPTPLPPGDYQVSGVLTIKPVAGL